MPVKLHTDIASGTGDATIISGQRMYYGCALINTGAADTTVRIRDGAGGAILDIFVIKAGLDNGSNHADGVPVTTGILIDRDATNAVEGVVYHS